MELGNGLKRQVADNRLSASSLPIPSLRWLEYFVDKSLYEDGTDSGGHTACRLGRFGAEISLFR